MTSAAVSETVQVVSAGSGSIKSTKESVQRVASPRKMASIYSSTTNSSTKISTSNGLLSRRKATRAPGLIPANDVRQRVLSAKVLRMKQLQNQLTDARQHIAELTTENRLLKAIHKRQESALAKHESSNAELPQLLNSHAEEVRALQSKFRSLKQQNKELQEKIKQKDNVILAVSDQNKHLAQLSKDRSLEERERLTERLRDVEARLMDKDNDVKLLSRRLQLELKSYKTQVHQENQKFRECYSKLERAHAEITRLTHVIESANLKDSPSFRPRNRARNRSADDVNRSQSTASLEGKRTSPKRPEAPRFLSPMRKAASPKLIHNKSRKTAKDASDLPSTADPDEEDEEFLPLPPIAGPTHKSMEIVEHRRHIEEIEAKLGSKSTSSIKASHLRIATSSETEFEQFEEEQLELEIMRKQLKDNMIKKESYLDAICDDLTKQSPMKRTEQAPKKPASKKNIDPQKKTKLLAALKAIDGNEDSFEKA